MRTVLLKAVPVMFGLAVLTPSVAEAQSEGSGKWKAIITQLRVKGAAELTVEPFRDQSRAKLTIRQSGGDLQLAWDIAIGRCGMDGAPVAAAAAFPQITTRLDGSGSEMTRIPKLESGKQYYLRVYDPKKQLTDNAAYGCANISEEP